MKLRFYPVLILIAVFGASSLAFADGEHCEALLLGAGADRAAIDDLGSQAALARLDGDAATLGFGEHQKVMAAASDTLGEIKTELDQQTTNGGEKSEAEAINTTVKKKITGRLGKALKTLEGGCLRSNPVALKNFGKTLGSVWAFQLTGYAVAVHSRSKEQNASDPIDFPFDVMANTAFMIWIQSEMNCMSTAPTVVAGAKPPASLKQLWHDYVYGDKTTLAQARNEYLGNVKNRYGSYLVTLPIGIASFTIIEAIVDAVRKKVEGKNSKRPDFFAPDHLQSLLSDAIFNTAFNTVWLFPRWAAATTPFELKLLPAMRAFAKSKGTVAGLGAAAGEWGYRIGMGLFDNWIFFKTRKDGIGIKGFVSFNPNKIAGKIMGQRKPKITPVKNEDEARKILKAERDS